MNLPNKLTVARICLMPVVCVSMYLQQGCMYIATILFIIASITDFADGRIARSRGLVTNFGKFLDPIADKLLVLCPLIIMVEMGRFEAWMCAVIVAREITVSGFRLIAALSNRVIAADKAGKLKTVTQMLMLICLFLFTEGPLAVVGIVLSYLAVALTAISGFECIWKNRDMLTDC